MLFYRNLCHFCFLIIKFLKILYETFLAVLTIKKVRTQVLYLVSNKLLNKPALYLSDFIERNKNLYYELLTLVRTHNDLGRWIKFFLTAVIETAKNGVITFQKILNLKHEIDLIIVEFGKKSKNAKKLIDFLYQKPIVAIADIAETLHISRQTANELVKEFINKNILIEITGFQRNKLFSFERYLAIYNKSDAS